MRHPAIVGAVALAATVALVVPATADTQLPAARDLEEVRERRAAVEERLATQAGDIEGIEQEIHAVEQEVTDLEAEEAELLAEVEEADARLSRRARLAFMHGDVSGVGMLLDGQDIGEVAERAALIQSLTLGDRAAAEEATAIRTALAVNREQRQTRAAELDELRAGYQEQADLLAADLEQLAADEARFAEELEQQREEARRQREAELRRQREAEAAERRAAEAERAAEAPAESGSSGGSGGGSDSGGSSGDAPSSGGLACPVGDPVFFTDTYGAPRSGGRSHQGVDMMAPHGTPVYAITSGKVTRMTGNNLGGISLYMYGDDGNQYYYTHLQGYASGTSVGQRVQAGTLIAYVGSTGNASSSAPHLHFEVQPGGGGSVNPYPYAAAACGR